MNTSTTDAIITRTQAADKIATSKGRYFSVLFAKKDGSLRKLVGRVGVRKGVTGQGLKFDPSVRGLRVVNETVIETEGTQHRTVAQQFRLINLNTLRRLNINGKRYAII